MCAGDACVLKTLSTGDATVEKPWLAKKAVKQDVEASMQTREDDEMSQRCRLRKLPRPAAYISAPWRRLASGLRASGFSPDVDIQIQFATT